MASNIDVINGALSKLGAQPILAVTDPSPEGRLANRTYEDIRDSLFREFEWNFATKRASLAANATAPEWGFARAYTLPTDLLRLISLNNDFDQDWRNEAGTIVTDMTAPLQIRYVALVPVDSMDSTFREALAGRLAMEWAEPLTQTSSVSSTMSALYRNKLQVARVADGQEDRVKAIIADDFIDARF
jgi:hypothetical protein